MPIYWTEFDWQSFATLSAGFMAATAAAIIGKRQVSIVRKQTEILERQVRLNELTLRHDLFDRRYQVFESVRDFVMYVIHHAEVDGGDIRANFLRAIGESRFLFRPNVNEKLEEIWQSASELAVLKAEMAVKFKREQHYGDGNPKKEFELLKRFSSYSKELVNVFGDEMQLGDQILQAESAATDYA